MNLEELIDKYEARTISDQELDQLKHEVETNAEAHYKLATVQAIRAAIKAEEKAALKQELRLLFDSPSFKEEGTEKETTDQTNKQQQDTTWSFIRIAASVALLIGVFSLIWFFTRQQFNSQELVAAHYQPYQVDLLRDVQEEALIYQQAIDTYSKGDFQKALTYIAQTPDSLLSSDKKALLTGNCYLSLQQSQQAIETLLPLTNQTTDFVESAYWYLSLAYLQQDNIIEAKNSLQKVIDQKGDYTGQAKKLLEKL